MSKWWINDEKQYPSDTSHYLMRGDATITRFETMGNHSWFWQKEAILDRPDAYNEIVRALEGELIMDFEARMDVAPKHVVQLMLHALCAKLNEVTR